MRDEQISCSEFIALPRHRHFHARRMALREMTDGYLLRASFCLPPGVKSEAPLVVFVL
jgi:hypothetical protein